MCKIIKRPNPCDFIFLSCWKIFLVSISILALHLNFVFSQTTIPGGAVSGTWSLASSPYLIAGSIYVPNDSTLSIEPGVVVNFQNTYKLLVLGRILAVGNDSNYITFTSQDTTAGWRGVRFENTVSTNDTSKILFCKFLYSKNAGSGEVPTAIFTDGFSKIIIENNRISSCAGAIRVLNCSPLIKHNTITYNSGGSTVYLNNSTTEFKFNVVVSNNLTSTSSGAVFVYDFNGKISNNIIDSNSFMNSYGGGIAVANGSPIIDSNQISNNSGSGIFKSYSSNYNLVISNNIISNNSQSGINGYATNIHDNLITGNYIGINKPYGSCPNNTVTIERNLIANNTLKGLDLCSNILISNNVIVNNGSASSMGGAIVCDGASPVLINNTIANNLALSGGAVYCKNNSDPTFTNNIIWGNTANNGQQIFLDDENSDPSFYYCDIEGGQSGIDANFNIFMGAYTNNIDSNPMFVIPSNGSGTGYNGSIANWSLQVGSGCINAGNPTGSYPLYDYAGNPRVIDGIIDIGAFEFACSAIPPIITASGATTFCQGDSVTLIANDTSAASYLWSNDATIQSIVVNYSGNFLVTIEDTNGCFATSDPVAVTVLAPTPTIIANNTVLTSSSSIGNQWYLNGTIIPGATSQTLNVTQNGSYTVVVTVDSCSSTSASYYFTAIKMDEFTLDDHVEIYPNPFNGKFKVYSDFDLYQIEIYSVLGEKLYQSTVSTKQGEVDFSEKPSGIYIMVITTENKMYRRKLIKR